MDIFGIIYSGFFCPFTAKIGKAIEIVSDSTKLIRKAYFLFYAKAFFEVRAHPTAHRVQCR